MSEEYKNPKNKEDFNFSVGCLALNLNLIARDRYLIDIMIFTRRIVLMLLIAWLLSYPVSYYFAHDEDATTRDNVVLPYVESVVAFDPDMQRAEPVQNE